MHQKESTSETEKPEQSDDSSASLREADKALIATTGCTVMSFQEGNGRRTLYDLQPTRKPFYGATNAYLHTTAVIKKRNNTATEY
jgi:hypothetical protein